MTGDELVKWREHMGWTQKQAREQLDLTDNAYRALERKGKEAVSKRTELACLALYLGPEKIVMPWLQP